MKRFRFVCVLLSAAMACFSMCGCSDDNGPIIKKTVSRISHFIRLDVISELLNFADVTCEYSNIFGELVTKQMYGTSTYITEDTWRPDSGIAEPEEVTITITATPRGDVTTTSSQLLFEVSLQSELTVYDQNNQAMGYNAIVKSLSKMVDAGTNVKTFLEANFPVSYSFVITKGDDGTYGVQVQ